MTYADMILKVLKEEDKPLQRRDFREKLPEMDDLILGVVLNSCVKNDLIVPVKYLGRPAFYCHPDWVVNGEVPGWDHIYKEWKTKPNGVKN